MKNELDNLIYRIWSQEQRIDFPKELDPKQEIALCVEYQKTKDKKILDYLAYHNIKFVYCFVRKFFNNVDFEEAFSLGLVGLTKSIATFDESADTPFKEYVATCVKHEIISYHRKRNTKKAGKDFELYNIDEIIENTTYTYDNVEKDAISKCLIEQVYLLLNSSQITAKQKDIICRSYGVFGKEEVIDAVLAQTYNCDRTSIIRARQRALKILNENLQSKNKEKQQEEEPTL